MKKIPLTEYWALLMVYLRPYRGQAVLMAVFLLSSIGLQLISPQILRSFIDAARSGEAAEALIRIALLFLGVAIVQQVATLATTYVGENLGWKTTNQLRLDLTRHCLALDMSFHNARSPGELIERVDGDVKILANFFSQLVVQVVGSGILIVGIIGLLFLEDGRVGVVVTLFAVVAMVVLTRTRGLVVPYWTATRQASAEMYGYVEERLAGTQDIRANGGRAYVMHHFYRLQRAAWRTTLKAGLMSTVMTNTAWVLFAIGEAVALAVGASRYSTGALTLGGVYLVFFYSSLINWPLGNITRHLDDLQKAGASIGRVKELTDLRSKIVDGRGFALQAGLLAVEFDAVSFGYGAGETVLHDLSFCLQPGTVLGLLGRTGSGKTTITRLLLRLYDPDQGAVRVGDEHERRDIREARLVDLGRWIGMVTQNVQLFDASVRDNLTLFDRRIDDQAIVRVIEELGLGTWFASLPQGLDTRLAGEGGGLSAGEGQLLAFCRIFLKDPRIVILDEASSRLDPATEQLVEHAVTRLVAGRTAIIIAHRLATVERATEIMILDSGRIREHGPREQLASDPASLFAHLLRTGGLQEVLV
jgi:ATP-binding cassette subfamily B protein